MGRDLFLQKKTAPLNSMQGLVDGIKITDLKPKARYLLFLANIAKNQAVCEYHIQIEEMKIKGHGTATAPTHGIFIGKA